MKLLVCDDDISTIDVIQSQLNLQELGITTLCGPTTEKPPLRS